MTDHDREFDLVVWGATGVAGRLTADYLTEQYSPDELTLAIGGRSEQRLDDLAADLTAEYDEWDEVPIVLGDATDQESLDELAERTKVVCTTVGPYTEYGSGLVEACVDAETHYCDLTGEVTWTREMIDRHHDDAVEAETRIVHSCGFDSVPADFGTYLAQTYAKEEFGSCCGEVRIYLEDGSGEVSGGTLASAATMFEAASTDSTAREVLRNPYSLAPPDEREGVDPGEQRGARRDPLRRIWTAPSPMAAINERVIRRSNALLGYPWGREFRCTEVLPIGEGLGGMATANAVAGGLGLATAGLSIGPVREAMERFVFPDPGEGPDKEEAEKGHFEVRVLGQGANEDGPFVVESVIAADQDPGYGATARMLGESAICLVLDEVDSPLAGGVLTPASGIGEPLADRLRGAGLTVEVGTWDGDED